jgi:YggT family protein
MGQFIYYVLDGILLFLILSLFASAVLSWLVAFDVINLRNRFVYQIARFFDSVSAPILRPFRRVIPNLGGVDISPIIAFLILQGVRQYLLPWIFTPIVAALGG